MWCPLCAAEYQAGYTRCSDCAVDLVTEKPDHTVGWYEGTGISHVEEHSYPETSELAFALIHHVVNELGWQIAAESQPYCALNAAATWKPNKVVAALGELDVSAEVDLRVLDESGGGSVVHVVAHTGHVKNARLAVRSIIRRFLDALDQALRTA